jgi:hypothetical protein
VRPGRGKQRYVLQQLQNGRWRSVGGVRTTDSRGFLTRRVRADRGSLFRLRLPEEDLSSPMLVAR